jgi:hypothetical protein
MGADCACHAKIPKKHEYSSEKAGLDGSNPNLH